MNWNEDIDLTKIKMTSRLIIERALFRGWKVCSFETNPAIMLIYSPGRETPIQVFSASPPQMSYPASKIANDKYITNQILAHHHLPVPQEMLVTIKGDSEVGDEDLEKYLTEYRKVVVKPLDASHGNGITTGITSIDNLRAALTEAKAKTNKKRVLIQEQLEGIDIRIVCIGYKFADAISRIPASITGDGEHSIRDLIGLTNQSDERGENYKAKLNMISLDKVRKFLGEDKLNEIPPKGVEVPVMGISNIGVGGVRFNIKQDVPGFLIDMAEKAARFLELPVCGVDFIAKRLPTKNDTIADLSAIIIEANACPMLTMYDDLRSPEQLSVIDKYLDFINEY
jgi:cyanophycin synthetase